MLIRLCPKKRLSRVLLMLSCVSTCASSGMAALISAPEVMTSCSCRPCSCFARQTAQGVVSETWLQQHMLGVDPLYCAPEVLVANGASRVHMCASAYVSVLVRKV